MITAPKSPFRDLKIESEHKRILKSLVGRHFQKQDIRRQNKDATLDQDFIRGKGSGLVILLHGVPGVGKTTTAEAVALDNRKPLFALTSGDLGSSSRDVETALRDTFRLAVMWDCVLLLDEADLFLAKRDVGDLVRNSLVSGTVLVSSPCFISLANNLHSLSSRVGLLRRRFVLDNEPRRHC